VATAELADAGRRVLLVDQEPEASLGGQAFWSFGGLFFVDSPEQRRMRIKDSRDLAWQDWLGTAGFDRPDDLWPRRWAEAYVDFAAGEKRSWLAGQGVKFLPNVGWAERGGYGAIGHGNSVPRFHVTWGTGPGIIEPFVRRVRDAARRGLVDLRFRHRVDELSVSGGAVTGVAGRVLAADACARGQSSNRDETGDFALQAQAVVVTTAASAATTTSCAATGPSGWAPRRST
jgi:predicted oxidoreductase